MDVGVDLHAGDEAQLPALTFEVAAAEVNQRAIGRFLDGLDSRVARPRFFLRLSSKSGQCKISITRDARARKKLH